MSFFQKLKQKIWYAIYPVFPKLERAFLFLHEKKRQQYHIGWLAPHHNLAGLKSHLARVWGFGNHFVAWEDKDQVLSWRKLDSFNDQYHLRVYSDGEIRGHYELTPEASPIDHFMSVDMHAKTRDFLRFLGPYVTTRKNISNVHPDTTIPSRDSEVTFS